MTEMQSSRRAPLERIQLDTSSEKGPFPANAIVIEATKGVHAGLWLDKYIANLKHEETTTHTRLVEEVASIPVPEIYASFYKRWKSNLKAEYHAISREFAVKGRMAVGLGNESVLETSVALHRTYGVPYIPGSALKGLAANYARLMAGPDWQPEGAAYKAVFGDTDNAGYITFFDALYIPESSNHQRPPDCPLHADIITVHHPEYYKGAEKASPADWDSPTPIPFLSATGSYLIALAAPNLSPDDKAIWDKWIEKVFEILTEALLIMGIGAKTSSGYGRMKTEPVLSAADEAALLAINEHLEKIKAMPDGQVTGQLKNWHYKWLQVKSQVARKVLAQAIVEKARMANKELNLINQPWYQSLLQCIK